MALTGWNLKDQILLVAVGQFPVSSDTGIVRMIRVVWQPTISGTMLIDRQNRLWAGTASAGLNMLDLNGRIEETPTFKRYQHHPNDPFRHQ